jgi:hypothetical protein
MLVLFFFMQPPHTSFHFLRCFWRLKRCCLLIAFTRNLLLHSTCVARNYSFLFFVGSFLIGFDFYPSAFALRPHLFKTKTLSHLQRFSPILSVFHTCRLRKAESPATRFSTFLVVNLTFPKQKRGASGPPSGLQPATPAAQKHQPVKVCKPPSRTCSRSSSRCACSPLQASMWSPTRTTSSCGRSTSPARRARCTPVSRLPVQAARKKRNSPSK